MVDTSLWDQILTAVDRHQNFIITTHINPDGDAIGSEIAISEFLKARGKRVHMINISATPENYRFLDESNEIIVYDSVASEQKQLIAEADVFIFVDISDWHRLRELGQAIQAMSAPKICIDHHHCEGPFSDLDVIYEEASSTGELIYDFLIYASHEFTLKIAKALYTCILTDTGSFRFSNTTARTHYIASQLFTYGFDARTIYQEVYERNTQSKIILMGKALSHLKFDCNDKLAWFVISREMFQESGADKWDTEGFPEIPRTIDGVEVSLMFTEMEAGKTKVSLRSKGQIVINGVAKKLGGGGHDFAAGAVVEKPLDETIEIALKHTKEVVCDEN